MLTKPEFIEKAILALICGSNPPEMSEQVRVYLEKAWIFYQGMVSSDLH